MCHWRNKDVAYTNKYNGDEHHQLNRIRSFEKTPECLKNYESTYHIVFDVSLDGMNIF